MTLCPVLWWPSLRIQTRSGRDFAALGAGWFQCGFFLEAARRQNQPFPSTSDVLLSVSNYPKVSDSHLKLIWNSLRCLLMWYGKRSHNKKVHQIAASDEEPGGVMHETFDQQDSEIWSVDGSSSSLMRTCCDCNSCCHGRTVPESPLKAKKSHGDHKEIDEHKLAGLPACQYHPTVWSTGIARTWKEPKDKWKQWCNFVCL